MSVELTHQQRATDILRVIDGAPLGVHLWDLIHASTYQLVHIARLKLVRPRLGQASEVGDAKQRRARCKRAACRRVGERSEGGEASRGSATNCCARTIYAAL